MFYVKTEISPGIEMKIDLYDDQIFTTCFRCNKEFQPTTEALMYVLEDGGDFASTQITCLDCDEILIASEQE